MVFDFSIWATYYVILVLLICVSSVKHSKLLIYSFLPVAVLHNGVSIGISVTGLKIVSLFILAFIVFVNFDRKFVSMIRHKELLYILPSLFLYSLISAFYVSHVGPTYSAFGTLQQPPFRGLLSTTLFFLVELLPLFILSIGTKGVAWFDIDKLRFLLRIFFSVASIVIAVALLAIISYQYLPSLNFAINFLDSGIESTVGKIILYRPSAFVHEPRYFGLAMSLVFMFLLVNKFFRVLETRVWIENLLLISSLGLLMLSMSVSSIVSFLFSLVVFLLWYFYISKSLAARGKVLLFIGLAVLIVIISMFFWDGLFARLERYMSQARLDRYSLFDMLSGEFKTGMPVLAYIKWLLTDVKALLFGVGLGNGGYYAIDFIDLKSGFFKDGILSSRVMIVDLIAGLGLLGTVLFYFIWFRWWRMLQVVKSMEMYFIRGTLLSLMAIGLINNTYALTWFFFGISFIVYNAHTYNKGVS